MRITATGWMPKLGDRVISLRQNCTSIGTITASAENSRLVNVDWDSGGKTSVMLSEGLACLTGIYSAEGRQV